MSTQAIVVTFEFKLEYDKQELKTKKKQAAASIINVIVINITEAISSEANPAVSASNS